MLPVPAPLRMREGSTAAVSMTLKNAAGADIDLTTWTAQAAVKKHATDSVTVMVFSCTVVGGTITLTPPVPNVLPVGRYRYDLVLTKPGGELVPVVEASLLEVFEGVTDAA